MAPAHVGSNTARIALRDAQGQPVEVLEVALRLSSPDRGVAPLERAAQKDGPGIWLVNGVILAVTGTWLLEVEVLVSDFERQTLTGVLDLD